MTSIIDRLRQLDSCAVSDARDQLRLPDATVVGIVNLTGLAKVAGRAVTVQLGAPRPTPSTRHLCTAAIEGAGDDDVIVIDHQGRTDCAAWGGNLSRGAAVRGVAGTVVNGAVRDVDEARSVNYPVYATASTPHTARGRTQEHGWNTTITFAGVTVDAGDYVVADSSGIVFTRATDIAAVLSAAERIVAAEAAIATAINEGTPVSRAMGATYEQMTSTTMNADDALAARLRTLDTSALSDALDRLGIEGQALGIAPLDHGFRTVGRAFTVRMLPRGLSGKSVGDYIDDVPAGAVVVIDNGGRLDATVWGDILTTVAHRDGVAGTVIDGVCRDVGRSFELRYPIFARGNTMRTGKDRVAAEAYGEPVQLAGVRVEPVDWIVGDADGVVVVPAARADDIVGAAEEITATEDHIRDAVAGGDPLLAVRERLHYHDLQTKR